MKSKYQNKSLFISVDGGRRDRDRMVVWFTVCAISAYHH